MPRHILAHPRKQVVLASAVQSEVPRDQGASAYPHSLDCIDKLDDISFWVLDAASGEIRERLILDSDYTYLTGHAGGLIL